MLISIKVQVMSAWLQIPASSCTASLALLSTSSLPWSKTKYVLKKCNCSVFLFNACFYAFGLLQSTILVSVRYLECAMNMRLVLARKLATYVDIRNLPLFFTRSSSVSASGGLFNPLFLPTIWTRWSLFQLIRMQYFIQAIQNSLWHVQSQINSLQNVSIIMNMHIYLTNTHGHPSITSNTWTPTFTLFASLTSLKRCIHNINICISSKHYFINAINLGHRRAPYEPLFLWVQNSNLGIRPAITQCRTAYCDFGWVS